MGATLDQCDGDREKRHENHDLLNAVAPSVAFLRLSGALTNAT